MDIFDFYFLWYNLTPIIIVIFGYAVWQIKIKNEELKNERERIIIEREQQRRSMEQALQTYERESTRFNETERKLQEIINRIERDNQRLTARTQQALADVEEKRKRLCEASRQNEYQYSRKQPPNRRNQDEDPDYQQIFENICQVAKIVGTIGVGLLLWGRR